MPKKQVSNITEDELKSIVSREILNANGISSSAVAQHRMECENTYRGEWFITPNQPGRSQVVMRDAFEIVQWLKPQLMGIFTGTEDPVEFKARNQHDKANAKVISAVINYVTNRQNDGFAIIDTEIDDGLKVGNSFSKIFVDEKKHYDLESYTGKTEDELNLLLGDTDVEPVKITERKEEHQSLQFQDGEPSQIELPEPPTVYDVVVRRWTSKKFIRIMPVPPEEIIVSRRAVQLDDCEFIGHRIRKTYTDLLEMSEAGMFPKSKLEFLPEENSEEFNPERVLRFKEDGFPYEQRDDAMRAYWLTEAYIRVDWNKDGKAELRKILVVGDNASVILSNEECDTHPFIHWTPIPEAHKLYGLGAVDITRDIQELRTIVIRQILDNMYHANNPRPIIQRGTVSVGSVLDNRFGSPILTTGDVNSSITWASVPFVGAQAFPVLEYTEKLRETRTGVSENFQGLNPDALNYASATASNQATNAAAQRLQLIARQFAEHERRKAIKVFELICKQKDIQMEIEVGGEAVTIDPSLWHNQYDVVVNVGLGTGDKSQRIAQLSQLLNIQVEGLKMQGDPSGPLFNLENVYSTVSELVEAFGHKNVEEFVMDPAKPPDPNKPKSPPPPQKPDPAALAAQQQAQTAQAKLQLEAQESQARIQNDQMRLQLEQQKWEFEKEERARKLMVEEHERQQRIQNEYTLALRKMDVEAGLKREQFHLEGAIKLDQIKADMITDEMKQPQVDIGGQSV